MRIEWFVYGLFILSIFGCLHQNQLLHLITVGCRFFYFVDKLKVGAGRDQADREVGAHVKSAVCCIVLTIHFIFFYELEVRLSLPPFLKIKDGFCWEDFWVSPLIFKVKLKVTKVYC